MKNNVTSLVNFNVSSRKSQNLHFDRLILFKAYKVLDEKLRKSYVSKHWRVIQRKTSSWEICIFSDAIDLKQSVEGTLKLKGKSLTTVLHEVHFIVNLYSFPLPLVPQANSFFVEIGHLSPSQTEQLPKLPPLFLLAPCFWGYPNSQVKTNKMVNSLGYHPCCWILVSRIHQFIFL